MGNFKPKEKKIFDAIDFYDSADELCGVEEIDIDLLEDFEGHPFKLYEGARLDDMVSSIKTYGIIQPLIVRKKKKTYEILAGHNRKNSAKLAGLTKVPCIVKEGLTDEEAWVYVIETNLMQRSFNDLLPSEKAIVLKERYDNIKSQGKRNDILRELRRLNGEETGKDMEMVSETSRDAVAEEYGLSGATMARLLRINNLVQGFKDMTDEKKLSLLAAVNLSYMPEELQEFTCDKVNEYGIKISEGISRKLRDCAKTDEILGVFLKPEKEKVQKVSVSAKVYDRYFVGKKKSEVEEIIEKALEAYFA